MISGVFRNAFTVSWHGTDAIRHHFVEIRDSAHAHKLITLLEIVSPSNKLQAIRPDGHGDVTKTH